MDKYYSNNFEKFLIMFPLKFKEVRLIFLENKLQTFEINCHNVRTTIEIVFDSEFGKCVALKNSY